MPFECDGGGGSIADPRCQREGGFSGQRFSSEGSPAREETRGRPTQDLRDLALMLKRDLTGSLETRSPCHVRAPLLSPTLTPQLPSPLEAAVTRPPT